MVPACSFGPSVKRLLAAPRSLLFSVSVKTCTLVPTLPESLELRTQLALSVSCLCSRDCVFKPQDVRNEAGISD